MHTSQKPRREVKKAFFTIDNSLKNKVMLLIATEIVNSTVWRGSYSYVRSVYCTNNVWEIRNILKCLYANPGFHFCNGEFYVDIPQVEKGLHNVLDCF